LIKYIKSVLWRVAKRLSYIEDARCLKVNAKFCRKCLLEVIIVLVFEVIHSWLSLSSYIPRN